MENNQEENTKNIINEDVPKEADIDKADSKEQEETVEKSIKQDSVEEAGTMPVEEKPEEAVEGLSEEKVAGEIDKETTLEESAKETTVEAQPVTAKESNISFEEETESENTNELVTVRPVKFKEFEPTPPNRSIKKNYDIMQDITMHVSVELGRTKSSIKEVIDLAEGSVVELDKIAGEQVEIYVNGKLVAKGEVIVIEDRFGVRVTSTNLQKGTANL